MRAKRPADRRAPVPGAPAPARLLTVVAGGALAFGAALAPPAVAGEDQPPPGLATVGAVLQSVGAQFPGQVLKIELEEDDDAPSGWAYEVKVLTHDGQAIEVKVDAASIARLEVEGASRKRSSSN